MSVRFGIASRGGDKSAQKKGAQSRVPWARAPNQLSADPRARLSLDHYNRAWKALEGPINRQLTEICGLFHGHRCRGDGSPSRSSRSERRMEAQPGLEPGYEAMHSPPRRHFRHRAVLTVVDHRALIYQQFREGCLNPNVSNFNQPNGCATNVMRAWLWPILTCARDARYPDASNLASISAAL